eukprot:Plantae.Rhodophyta-Rhodochaete_pulchella.ctg9862.p1 GENE.Plantae.Rhodophyta-Rhodochaete_pulchella.ctg9862~~Plantae.Rhodophyta-Rhodochaete_pulchella.ctg9862.p1  ORF type:complete len:166 (-),score=10.22 Plantae.Rhodophyta-Rhodochaete_pulchella.ctg9862:156-653(-)
MSTQRHSGRPGWMPSVTHCAIILDFFSERKLPGTAAEVKAYAELSAKSWVSASIRGIDHETGTVAALTGPKSMVRRYFLDPAFGTRLRAAAHDASGLGRKYPSETMHAIHERGNEPALLWRVLTYLSPGTLLCRINLRGDSCNSGRLLTAKPHSEDIAIVADLPA